MADKSRKAVLGVIGGSGVYQMDGLANTRWETVPSSFGEPSDQLLFGDLDGQPMVFLPRHGRGHRYSPTDINYRANIDAMKRAGVTDIISVSAVGSLKQEYAPGHFVRQKYLDGEGIYGCVAVDHDATGDALAIALAVAKAVGSTRAGVVEMSFQHETEGDNFEEQILYGGAIQLMKLCFQTMVDNGYPPSFAYAKAIRSLRSVIDVMDDVGIEEYVSRRCSRTAELAIRTRGPRVVNEEAIREIFQETERGEFARDWMQEWALGMPMLHRKRRTAAESQMEKTGHEWRREFGK